MLTELVDYKYYSETYEGSSIPESSFKKTVIKASSKINYYTSNRINVDNLDDIIKNTACVIAELLYEQELLKDKIQSNAKESKEIASESLGPRSISYVNKLNLQSNLLKSESELNRNIYNICKENLVNTGLMYRGVYK